MYVKVKVTADAKKETIKLVGDNRFVLEVKEPAEQNHANRRVREMIAAHYGISVAQVKILNGHHSPSKLLAIDAEPTS
jgi:uncharacterized protein YggU (UPF0235/DUF167 family)